MNLKICGIRHLSEIRLLNQFARDSRTLKYFGVILFFPKSHRNISLSQAKKILAEKSPRLQSVAVVVDPTEEQLEEIRDAGFDVVQIHGTLPTLPPSYPLPVWKAFNGDEVRDLDVYRSNPLIQGFVFDNGDPGSGMTHNWNDLVGIRHAIGARMFILAGGLNPDNLASAHEILSPDLADVSSGVEKIDRTGKDPDLVQKFIKEGDLIENNNVSCS